MLKKWILNWSHARVEFLLWLNAKGNSSSELRSVAKILIGATTCFAVYVLGQSTALQLWIITREPHLAPPAMVENWLLKLKGGNLYPRACSNPIAECQLSGDYLIWPLTWKRAPLPLAYQRRGGRGGRGGGINHVHKPGYMTIIWSTVHNSLPIDMVYC